MEEEEEEEREDRKVLEKDKSNFFITAYLLFLFVEHMVVTQLNNPSSLFHIICLPHLFG